MDNNASPSVPRLFRVILPVSDIDRAAEFYGTVLGFPGERVAPNRHYFDCGGTILACVDPQPGGREVTPNPEHIYFAVSDIDAVYERARQAGCQQIEDSVQTQHWGERAFFAVDPSGNPVCFVDEATLYTGVR
jgi:predicted enzyme related to lactoylglutathione lyase